MPISTAKLTANQSGGCHDGGNHENGMNGTAANGGYVNGLTSNPRR